MILTILPDEFTVCKLADCTQVDLRNPFTFLSVTDDEISLVCYTAAVPANATHAKHNWRALKIEGELDFALVGIIARIAGLLAAGSISVFVVSTYNTDYILVQKQSLPSAIAILKSDGCQFA